MKAQSEVIGYIIIFGSFFVFISLVGFTTFSIADQQNRQLNNERFTYDMRSLSDNINSLSYNSEEFSYESLSASEQGIQTNENLTITISKGSTEYISKNVSYVLKDINNGNIHYISSGLFFSNENNTLLFTDFQSRFQREKETLYIPLISVSGEQNELSSNILIREGSKSTQVIQVADKENVEIELEGEISNILSNHLSKTYQNSTITNPDDNTIINIENSNKNPIKHIVIKEVNVELVQR